MPVVVEQPARIEAVPELCIGEISIDKVDINSAIHIARWNVQKESAADCTISIDFFNLSSKIITAVLFTANGLNSFGDPILIDEKETFDILGQDICVKPGKFGNIKVKLPNQDIRKVKLVVKKVCCSDGEIAQAQPSCWIATKQRVIEQKYADCIKRKNPKGAYYAIIEDNYWQCTCGFVNVGHTCLVCGTEKLVASEFTVEKIEESYQRYFTTVEAERRAEQERAKELAEQAENERREAECVAKRNKRIAFITTPIVCSIIGFIIIFNAVIIPNGKYNDAITLMDSGNIIEAYDALVALDGFKDSADIANSIYDKYKDEKLKVANVGDYVLFGAYEQDNNTENGAEDVAWLVLEKNNDCLLLISEKCLTIENYNRKIEDITWETCSLRTWLNNKFFNMLFTSKEADKIMHIQVNSIIPANNTNDTTDKITLLSVEEAEKYFPTNELRTAKPTEYARSLSANINKTNGNAFWWLRTQGWDASKASCVTGEGSIGGYAYVSEGSNTIRPVIWVRIN